MFVSKVSLSLASDTTNGKENAHTHMKSRRHTQMPLDSMYDTCDPLCLSMHPIDKNEMKNKKRKVKVEEMNFGQDFTRALIRHIDDELEYFETYFENKRLFFRLMQFDYKIVEFNCAFDQRSACRTKRPMFAEMWKRNTHCCVLKRAIQMPNIRFAPSIIFWISSQKLLATTHPSFCFGFNLYSTWKLTQKM